MSSSRERGRQGSALEASGTRFCVWSSRVFILIDAFLSPPSSLLPPPSLFSSRFYILLLSFLVPVTLSNIHTLDQVRDVDFFGRQGGDHRDLRRERQVPAGQERREMRCAIEGDESLQRETFPASGLREVATWLIRRLQAVARVHGVVVSCVN